MENSILEIAKYTLPALTVLAATYLTTKTLLEAQAAKQRLENRKQADKILTPAKLQAYERIVLFLERISPQSLLVRTNDPKLNVKQFQQLLLANIRQEFEHNLSQQLYVSEEAWSLVRNAKENMTRLVNTAASGLEPTAQSIELSKILMDLLARAENSPLDATIRAIKKEFTEVTSQVQ